MFTFRRLLVALISATALSGGIAASGCSSRTSAEEAAAPKKPDPVAISTATVESPVISTAGSTLDARIENVVKTIVRCAFFGVSPRVAVLDLEDPAGQEGLLDADLCHHVGVLYHLSDPVAHLQSVAVRRGAERLDHARQLVPEPDRHIRAEEALGQMRVRAADRRVGDADADILRAQLGLGHVDEADDAAGRLVGVAETADPGDCDCSHSSLR